MRIAVNAGSLKNYRLERFIQLAKLHPQHTFLFFFDTENNSTDLPENITSIVITPPAAIPLKWRIWYNLKLPSALKKNKADVFISERFVSLKTKVPQILMQSDLTILYQPSVVDKKQISFYKKNTSRFFEKANAIIVNSVFLKKEIIGRFHIHEEKIQLVYPAVKNLRSVTFEERELMKEKYAEGNEYFIYKGIISTEKNLVNLLKAYSFFKKRQRSKMQLLITGTPGERYQEFVRSLQSYKFKNDVKLLADLTSTESEKVLACAYSMVYIPFYENEGTEVLEAMKSEVPLIVSDTGFLKEYCGDVALYVKPDKINDIAEKMMLLFKDEQKRKELIEKGRSQISLFENKNPTEALFQIIDKVAAS
jgi:glycosyltransferase involved in cell wall biosynthesis